MKIKKLFSYVLTAFLAMGCFVSCEKKDTPKSAEKQITAFSINQTAGMIDEDAKTIAVTLPFGTNITALAPAITVSDDASISPASGIAKDFTNPVTYTVTAEDGTTQDYVATVIVTANNEAKINSFVFTGLTPAVTAIINETDKTITAVLPKGTDLIALSPEIVVSANAHVLPESGSVQDFSSPVIYKVTAEDGTEVSYTANISVAKSSDKQILSFKVNEVSAAIDETAKKITHAFPYGTDITALAPVITVSDGASVSPASGVAKDFTNPVIYKVTAEDESTVQYTATITVKAFETSITGVSSTTLKPDEALTISGVFAESGNVVELEKGGDLTELSITAENANSITAVIPQNIAEGEYALHVTANGTKITYTENITIAIPALEIFSVDDLNPCKGTNVTIIGSNFGDDANVGLYEDGWWPGTTEIVAKTSTQITFKTDYLSENNNYTIKVASNGKTVTFNEGVLKVQKCAPVFSSLNKSEAAIGDEIIITGNHFIAFPAHVSIIVGEQYTTGTVQNNTTITFTIPEGVTPGKTDIVVSDKGVKLIIPITIIEN